MRDVVLRLCLALALVAAPGLASESVAQTNLLANPGFEDNGGSYNGWFTFGSGVQLSLPGGDNIIRTGVAASKIYGEFSGCPGSPAFSVGGYGQAFTPTAGKVYQLRGYAFVSVGDTIPGIDTCTGNRCIAKVVFFDAASGGNEICGNEIVIGDWKTVRDQWNEFSVSIPAPSTALRVEALILFLQPACDAGSVFLDDLSFYELTEAAEPNLLANPSFTGSLAGWTTFGNAYYDARSWARRTPTGCAKMFSSFDPLSDTGIYQSLPALPDSGYHFSVYSLNTCRENPVQSGNDNFAIAHIQFRDAGGTIVGWNDAVIADSTSPLGTWTKHTVYAQAPATAESVDVYLLFISPSLLGGAFWVDDASLRSGPAAGVPGGVRQAGFQLHRNVPNPFDSATRLSFDLEQAAHVRLCVYDVRGSLVSTIVDGELASGRQEFSWDGRDARGIKVASGIYFCRLAVDGGVQTASMMLVR